MLSICTLETGKEFGKQYFFSNNPEPYGVKSKDFTIIYKIKRTDFLNFIKEESDEVFERFNVIKDSIQSK